MNRASQCERILAHLQKHGSITPLEALKKYGCFRLSGRIHNLREHCKIKTQIVKTRSGKHVARYSLA